MKINFHFNTHFIGIKEDTSNHSSMIYSRHFSNQQILVGRNNDMKNFEFDQADQWEGLVCGTDIMRTSTLTFQNGKVIESECKGHLTFNKRFDDNMV